MEALAKTAAGLAIAKQFGDMALAASNFEVNMRGLAAVAGDVVAGDIAEWAADTGAALNLSQADAIEAAKGFALYGKQAGLAEADAAGFTTSLTTLSAELAAFAGARPDEVIGALGAALRGEFDPLERFGIALKASQVEAKALELGLVDVGEEMSNQAKIQATYALLMEEGAFAMGSTERNADTLSGQLADLTAKWEDITLQVGRALLPVLETLAGAVGGLVAGFGALPEPLQTAVVLFGGLTVAVKALAPAVGTLRAAMVNLSADVGRASGGVSRFKAGLAGVVAAVNPVTLAVTAGVTALTLWAASAAESKASADAFARALSELPGDDTFRRLQLLNDQLEGMGAGWLEEWLSDTDTAADALDVLGLSLEEFDAALNGSAEDAEAFRKKLRELSDGYAGPLGSDAQKEADAAGVLLRAFDDLSEGQDRLTDSSDRLQGSAQGSAQAVDAAGEAAAQAATDVEDLRDAFTVLNEQFIDGVNAAIDYEEALDDLASTVTDPSNWDIDTETGRSNMSALVDLVESANDDIRATMENQGVDAAAAKWGEYRAEIEGSLTGAGVSAEQAKRLLDNVFGAEYEITAQLGEISVAEAEAGLTDDIARLQGRLEEALGRRDAAEAEISVAIKEGESTQVIADLTSQLQAEDAAVARVTTRLAGKRETLAEIQGLTEGETVDIGTRLVESEFSEVEDALEGLKFDRDGKARQADIDAAEGSGFAAVARELDDLARDRTVTITVRRAGRGGGAGGGAGAGALVAPRGAEDLLAEPVFMSSSRSVGVSVPAVGAGGGTTTLLAPRREKVAVYLDGAEIASHLDTRTRRTAVAAAGSRRRP